jgi:hypothetical protein
MGGDDRADEQLANAAVTPASAILSSVKAKLPGCGGEPMARW